MNYGYGTKLVQSQSAEFQNGSTQRWIDMHIRSTTLRKLIIGSHHKVTNDGRAQELAQVGQLLPKGHRIQMNINHFQLQKKANICNGKKNTSRWTQWNGFFICQVDAHDFQWESRTGDRVYWKIWVENLMNTKRWIIFANLLFFFSIESNRNDWQIMGTSHKQITNGATCKPAISNELPIH